MSVGGDEIKNQKRDCCHWFCVCVWFFGGGLVLGFFFLYIEFSLVLQTCKPPRAVPWFGLAVVCRIPQESC